MWCLRKSNPGGGGIHDGQETDHFGRQLQRLERPRGLTAIISDAGIWEQGKLVVIPHGGSRSGGREANDFLHGQSILSSGMLWTAVWRRVNLVDRAEIPLWEILHLVV